jgi:hypothetical protein
VAALPLTKALTVGRKQQWFKKYSEASLADHRLRSLTVSEKGIYWDMIDFLRTQTDIPGYFIINGKILTIDEIKSALRKYSAWTQGGLRWYSAWTQRILDSGLIRTLSDGVRKGVYYSPRVVEEYEEYNVRKKAGMIRYYGSGDHRGHQRGDGGGDVEENKNKKRGTGTGSGPRSHFRVDPTSVPDAPSLEEILADIPDPLSQESKKGCDGDEE